MVIDKQHFSEFLLFTSTRNMWQLVEGSDGEDDEDDRSTGGSSQ